MIDLQFLILGIKGNGNFDERKIEESRLKKLGVGRILDQLASLKERNLITMKKDGSFSVTDYARHILWDNQIPNWVKILRILEIKSQNLEDISSFLQIPPKQVQLELEDLRKRQLALMSPLRNESGLSKMYEILPEGIEQIAKAQSEGLFSKAEPKTLQKEILLIINKTIEEINEIQEFSDSKKNKIISNLIQIKEKLEM